MGTLFLGIKLGYEWPSKFHHFGAYIKPEAWPKYEDYLGNEHLQEKGLPPRVEITGYLKNHDALHNPEIKFYEIQLDAVNADPRSEANDRPHFIPRPISDKVATVAKEDVSWASMWLPKHSTYFAVYYTITGLHGLHVLGGLVLFAYFLLPVSTRLYQKDPDHLANRIECVGLFWHFVDLVWIFAFPLFYLL
jgi:cytochrome c oxidase subunit 3